MDFTRGPTAGLTNTGVGWAQNDAYTLLAVSPDIPGGAGHWRADPRSPRWVNTPGVDDRDVGLSNFIWVFAINTHERQSHLVPVSYQLFLDTTRTAWTTTR